MAQFERPAQADDEAGRPPNTSEMLNPNNGPAKGFALAGATAQNMMRCNLELFSLASRRARAQMDLPRKAMACRSTTDFNQLGVAFWHQAFQDYIDCNQRLMACWTQTLTEVGQTGIARSMTDFANVALQPIATAAEEAGAAMTEHPTEPWAWWRTDMKGLKPSRNGNGNGHHSDHSDLRAGP